MEQNQMLISIFVGIGTGLISSLLFLWFLTKLRPKMVISDQIAFDQIVIEKTNMSCFRFKVINRTWLSKIYDIEAQLVLITLINADGGFNIYMSPIKLIKDKTWSLNKVSQSDKHAEYAFQFITTENLEELWLENQNIELRIKAKHAFSGFSKTSSKRYFKPVNSIKKGSFKFGNTLEIS
ncbi:hypothetical protein MMU07_03550 [Aquiflexum sp. LQ15W]|uniref:hypothetical protein n=1 Tax=Cognataquiflexum nitidum TaxID=2922272 RepID=UPI001F130605|nr:hypothetical protein [Cognataquiflexum nitidum]MCH6198641.1 hypothetical protein [Cognataquiflexum nitidum]